MGRVIAISDKSQYPNILHYLLIKRVRFRADVIYGRPLPCGQIETPLSEQGAPLPLPKRYEIVVVGVQEREFLPALDVLLDLLALDLDLDLDLRNLSVVGSLPPYNLLEDLMVKLRYSSLHLQFEFDTHSCTSRGSDVVV